MLGKHTQKNSLSSKRRTDDNLQQYIQEQIKNEIFDKFSLTLEFLEQEYEASWMMMVFATNSL